MNAEELEAVSLACKPAGDVYCLIAKKMGTCNFVGSRYLDEGMRLYIQAVGAIESQTLRELNKCLRRDKLVLIAKKKTGFLLVKENRFSCALSCSNSGICSG
jgi:hypothetical protein